MRTDYDLMYETIAGFSMARPTADGAADQRITTEPTVSRRISLPERAHRGMGLRELLEHRSSALAYGTDGLFITERLASLRDALRRDRSDWGDTARDVPLEGFLFALNCIDLPPGVYRVDDDIAAHIGDLPTEEHREDLAVQKEFARASAIVSVAADLDRADTWGGTHGYRIAMARAAAVVYDFHLDCVGQGLVGTVFAGFIPASVRTSLQSDGARRQPMFAATVAPPLREEPAASGTAP